VVRGGAQTLNMASGEMVSVEVKGLAELQARLEAAPEKMARNGLRKALVRGGTIFRVLMYQLAPKDTGFLAEHFGIRVRLRGGSLAGTAYIGPQGKIDYPDAGGGYREKISKKSGKKFSVGRIAVATVARFLEFGTSKMAKKPFMTQAFESGKTAALANVEESLRETLETL